MPIFKNITKLFTSYSEIIMLKILISKYYQNIKYFIRIACNGDVGNQSSLLSACRINKSISRYRATYTSYSLSIFNTIYDLNLTFKFFETRMIQHCNTLKLNIFQIQAFNHYSFI